MNTKLLLQILLLLGCVALLAGIVRSVYPVGLVLEPEGWWRGAIACWMLIVAIRMVYPAHAK